MKPIFLVLQPSYALAALLTVMGLLSCLSNWFAPIALLTKLTLGLVIVFTTVYFIARDVLLLLPKSWRQVEVNDKGRLILTNSNGERFNTSVKTNSYVALYLVILHVDRLDQVEGINPISDVRLTKKYWLNRLIATWKPNSSLLVLSPDSANQDNLRQIRVWLSWWQHSHTDNHADAEF